MQDKEIYDLIMGIEQRLMAAIGLVHEKQNKTNRVIGRQRTEIELINKTITNGITADINSIKTEISEIKKQYEDDKKCRDNEAKDNVKERKRNKFSALKIIVTAVGVSVALTTLIINIFK